MWTIQLFGGLSAHSPQRQLTRFRTQKAASLLAYLAFHPAPQPREVLLDLFWPDAEPEVGRHNLSNALSFLRHQLEPPGVPPGTVILADRASVRLNPAAVTVDAVEFERELRQAHAEGLSEEERLTRLLRAMERYAGALLPGSYEAWVTPEALRLEGLFVQGVLQLVPLLLGAGRPEGALGHAQRAVILDPLSEETIRCVMQAFAACGQVSQALRAYRALETRLQEELQAQPSLELKRLAEQLGQRGSSGSGLGGMESVPPPGEGVALAPASPGRSAPAEPGADTDVGGAAPAARLLGGEFLLRTTTRFFGREEEIDRLGSMLSTPRTRLVTLTGSGGTGKTRLALEVAAHLVERTADIPQEDAPTRVVFVSLAPITEGDRLFEVILRSLGIVPVSNQEPLSQLASVLNMRPNTLLVLDNFEQLVAEGALDVHNLLARSASCKLLVTSRQKLHIEGEREFHLAPLPTSGGALTPEEMLLVPSVALFVDRAQTVLPDFHLTERNAAAIGQLCDYLEGLPLAIELAAARVGVLTPARILEQVQTARLDFLTTRRRDAESRQKTLRATLDWSYQLLSEPAQAFLASLSAFRGGWTLEAAQAVCALSEEEMLEWTTLLRDSSILQVTETDEGMRFTLLETIREYGQERLRELGADSSVGYRHRDYFAALLEQAAPELRGPYQVRWLQRLEMEHDNLRVALAFCETDARGAEAGLRLAGALAWFWDVRGDYSEGRTYLGRALEREGAQEATVARAQALNGAGDLAYRQGDYASAQALSEEALTIQRALADQGGIANSLLNLGRVASSQGDYEGARTLFEQGLTLYREVGNRSCVAKALNALGNLARIQGELGMSRMLYEKSLAIWREIRDKRGIAGSLYGLGILTHYQGNFGAAGALWEESLVIYREIGDKKGIANSLTSLGNVAYNQSDYIASHGYYEEALVINREIGHRMWEAVNLNNLGCVAHRLANHEAARTLYEESLAIRRDIGDRWGIANSLNDLGNLAKDQGNYEAARTLYEECLTLSRESEDVIAVAQALEDFAGMAVRQGQSECAVRLLGAAEALCANLGRTLPLSVAVEYERTVNAARTELSADAFANAWEQGRAMTFEQAVAYALEGGASAV